MQAIFADNAAATDLGDTATQLQKLVQDRLSKQAESAPPQFRAMLDPLLKGGALWQTEAAEKTTTIKVDNLLSLLMMR